MLSLHRNHVHTRTHRLMVALASTALLIPGLAHGTAVQAQPAGGADALIAAQANANLKPLQVTIRRTDTSFPVAKGTELRYTLSVYNPNDVRVNAFPRASNLTHFGTFEANNCFFNLSPKRAFDCQVTHVVKQRDVDAGYFAPHVQFDITADKEGKQVLVRGAGMNGGRVEVVQLLEPPQGIPVPFEITWERFDLLGTNIRQGDTLQWHIKVKNLTGATVTAFPRASNLDGALLPGPHNCRYIGLGPGATYTCATVQHTISAKDVQHGSFTPTITLDATYDTEGKSVAVAGKPIAGAVVNLGSNNNTNPGGNQVPQPGPTVSPAPQPPSPGNPGPAPRPNPSDETRPGSVKVERISGPSRVETAVQISQADFREGTDTVIIARADNYADSVAAVPLAQELRAPVLLTQSDGLHPAVAAELQRLQPRGGKVIVMGGAQAIHHTVGQQIRSLGHQVERIAGANRAATAVMTAQRLAAAGKAKQVLVADGNDWQSSLVAGPAAAEVDAAVLLTNGNQMAPETAAFLRTLASTQVRTIGDSAKVALPSANNVAGAGSDLSVAVANTFFAKPKAVGVATNQDFADALSGGAHIARQDGPLILVPPTTPTAVTNWFKANAGIQQVYVYGGEVRISNQQAEGFAK